MHSGSFRLFDCKELALTSFNIVIVTRAEGGQEPDQPNLRLNLDSDTGQLHDIFTYPFDHARANDGMTTEAVAEHLEQLAPWRA